MLFRSDGSVFASGTSSCFDEDRDARSDNARIHVRVEFDGVAVFAMLDTGASWSVVNAELAEDLGLFDRDGEPVDVSSRMGTFRGKLVRAVARLLAEAGESVEVESTLFVSREWPAGNFIGYSGLLERIRFAVDPDTNSFMFGAR